jgi:hypothetical protein
MYSYNNQAQALDSSGTRNDMAGLLQYLNMLQSRGDYFTEALLVKNWWRAAHFFPLRHSGLILRSARGEHLSLDMMREGLEWNVAQESYPGHMPFEMPRHTQGVQKLVLSYGQPSYISNFVAQNSQFNWFGGNCYAWADQLRRYCGAQQYV